MRVRTVPTSSISVSEQGFFIAPRRWRVPGQHRALRNLEIGRSVKTRAAGRVGRGRSYGGQGRQPDRRNCPGGGGLHSGCACECRDGKSAAPTTSPEVHPEKRPIGARPELPRLGDGELSRRGDRARHRLCLRNSADRPLSLQVGLPVNRVDGIRSRRRSGSGETCSLMCYIIDKQRRTVSRDAPGWSNGAILASRPPARTGCRGAFRRGMIRCGREWLPASAISFTPVFFASKVTCGPPRRSLSCGSRVTAACGDIRLDSAEIVSRRDQNSWGS